MMRKRKVSFFLLKSMHSLLTVKALRISKKLTMIRSAFLEKMDNLSRGFLRFLSHLNPKLIL